MKPEVGLPLWYLRGAFDKSLRFSYECPIVDTPWGRLNGRHQYTQTAPTSIYENNCACIAMSTNLGMHCLVYGEHTYGEGMFAGHLRITLIFMTASVGNFILLALCALFLFGPIS